MAKRYTLYNTDTNTIEATGRPWPTADGVSEPVGMPINLVLLEEIKADRPAYDSAAEKLVENAIAYDTTAKTATRSWSAVALTQAELDERIPEHYETSTGIKMAIDLQSQAAFSNMMILLNEAGMADTDPVAIKDCFGVSHGMTVAEFRTQAVAYGLHCYTIFHS
jgi:hypothetical protein